MNIPQPASTLPVIHVRRRVLLPIAIVAVAAIASCGGSDGSPDEGAGSSSTPMAPTPEVSVSPTVVTTAEAPSGGYAATDSVATFDGATDPIELPLPDGVYWSWEYVGTDEGVEFVLSQLFTGDACLEQFGDSPEACASDNNTLYEPSATITMSPATSRATVLVSDEAGGYERFAVTAAEFIGVAAGQTPAADAPAGFVFERHPVVITVNGGEVVAVDQVFMS